MSSVLLKILGVIIIIMAIWGIFTGKVMAGSKGLQPNYYNKNESPILFYFFICIYLGIGVFVLFNS